MYKKAYLLLLPLVMLLSGCGSDDGASRIVVGPSKVLLLPNSLQYEQGFVVQVTDNQGNPAPFAIVQVEMVPVQYFKGSYIGVDTDGDSVADEWSISYSASCDAEDANHNGVLETGEDINGNGSLEPTNPATLAQHPEEIPTFAAGSDRIITDSSGFGFFSVTYPVAQAFWSRMQLTVSSDVSGTEENEDYSFILAVATGDIDNFPDTPPGGTRSPYGVSANCADSI